jgi:uncharacterized protein (TIGR03085 family)
MTSVIAAERAALADELARLGPGRPTLCAGWSTSELAAHLAFRDRLPLTLPGALAGRLRGAAEPGGPVFAGFQAARSYPECVALFRAGPPPWLPLGLPVVGEFGNQLEFVVHHEDARRGEPGWEPRRLPDELVDKVWSATRLLVRPALRRALDGVRLVRSDTGAAITAHRGDDPVIVTGDPVELALFATGRRGAARVEVTGDPDAVARLAATRVSI